MVEIARCTRLIRWCLDFRIIDVIRQVRGTLEDACPTTALRKCMSVGIFCCSSSRTDPQLNCLTACTGSLRRESRLIELMLLISDFIFITNFDIANFAFVREPANSANAAGKLVCVIRFITFCRDGVLILYLRAPPANGMMTYNTVKFV